jgi:hypothetical protein
MMVTLMMPRSFIQSLKMNERTDRGKSQTLDGDVWLDMITPDTEKQNHVTLSEVEA